jgi:cytochrome c556
MDFAEAAHRRVAATPIILLVTAALLAAMGVSPAIAANSGDVRPLLIAERPSNVLMHRHVDDLLAIAAALKNAQYDKAADIADKHLGIRSLGGKPKGATSDTQDSQVLWEKGLEFRDAASRFAGHARIVQRNPEPIAKAALFDSFTRMLSICDDCHEVFRIR